MLDRGGTVRAAARAVGVPEDAGYNWLRNSGLMMQRAAPRRYTAEEKVEFLRLVAQRQVIAAVAVELEIHRPPPTPGRGRRESSPAKRER